MSSWRARNGSAPRVVRLAMENKGPGGGNRGADLNDLRRSLLALYTAGPGKLRLMTSILVVGAGAVGALFGSALARQGAQVSVVCRSDFEAVQRDGYDILSPSLGNHRFRPHAVY